MFFNVDALFKAEFEAVFLCFLLTYLWFKFFPNCFISLFLFINIAKKVGGVDVVDLLCSCWCSWKGCSFFYQTFSTLQVCCLVVVVVAVVVVVVYEMTHCMMAVSLPPVEMRRLSSGRNSTLVTWELWPPQVWYRDWKENNQFRVEIWIQ